MDEVRLLPSRVPQCCCRVGSRTECGGEIANRCAAHRMRTVVVELTSEMQDVRAVTSKTAQIAAHRKLSLLPSNSTV